MFKKTALFSRDGIPYHTSDQTWNLSKNLHRRILRLKILHRQFHLISTVLVGKNTKNERKWRNLHHWQKFYTVAGSDGSDKFHLCIYPKHPLIFTHFVTSEFALHLNDEDRDTRQLTCTGKMMVWIPHWYDVNIQN